MKIDNIGAVIPYLNSIYTRYDWTGETVAEADRELIVIELYNRFIALLDVIRPIRVRETLTLESDNKTILVNGNDDDILELFIDNERIKQVDISNFEDINERKTVFMKWDNSIIFNRELNGDEEIIGLKEQTRTPIEGATDYVALTGEEYRAFEEFLYLSAWDVFIMANVMRVLKGDSFTIYVDATSYLAGTITGFIADANNHFNNIKELIKSLKENHIHVR